MAAPTKLFLEKNHIDGRFKVLDEKGSPFGDGEMPDEAIKSARIVSKAPIYFGSGVAIANKDEVFNTYECIEELACLAGMRVRQAYDDNMNIIGWTMEVKE